MQGTTNQATPDSIEKIRKNRYIHLSYVILMGVFSFYLYRFNFVHEQPQFNAILLPAYIVAGTLPIWLRHTKKLSVAFGIMFSAVVTMAAVMIYAAGGIQAPGTFWLSLAPVLGGLILRKRGVVIGSMFAFAILFIFIVLDGARGSPSFISTYQQYIQEKKVNLILFSFTILVMTYYWVHFEERLLLEINQQKQSTEELVRLLTHDIASPIQAIAMRLFFLKERTPQTPEAMQSLNRIELQLKNMSELLERVRSMRAIEDEKMPMEFEKHDMCKLLSQAASLAEERANAKDIEIKINFEQQPIEVLTDRALFVNQVLMNFLSNAIKFSNSGSKILISCGVLGDSCVVRIADSGIGIPGVMLDTIFSINAKTSRKGTNGESGTGFGMPLAKKCIERLGGTVEIISKEISSHPDKSGTEVAICIPVKR